MLDPYPLLLSLGISGAVTAAQIGLERATSQQLPERIDVWYPDALNSDYYEVTVFGDRERRYMRGEVIAPCAQRCSYCRSITTDESRCRSCGAPL